MSKVTHKVLLMKERTDGTTWWMQLGSGAPTKEGRDGALNLYLDTLPSQQKDGTIRLYVVPYTEQEQREREERRAAYRARGGGGGNGRGTYEQSSARGTVDYNGLPASGATAAADSIPF
jgi:hypothetical protein